MYDYQAQTSLPPIRARQQRQNGVQVQQLYESSPVIAALSHHPPQQYTSHKLPYSDPSALANANSTTVTSNGSNGYHSHSHHHNGINQAPTQPQTSDQTIRRSPSVDSVLSIHSSSQQRRLNNSLDPDTAMKTYMSKLTPYERHEIFSYPQIYFVGQNARKRQGVSGGPNNGMIHFFFQKYLFYLRQNKFPRQILISKRSFSLANLCLI